MNDLNQIREIIEQCQPVEGLELEKAKKRIDSLVKPLGSLGGLEKIAMRIAAIQKADQPQVSKRITVVMAADHGIVAEGIACAPQTVTAMQTLNMLKGITGVCVLSDSNGADLEVVDLGVKEDLHEFVGMKNSLINRKISYGSRNFAKAAALECSDVEQALLVGIERVKNAVDSGYHLIGTGEMGIGNTSVSSAVLMAFTGKKADLLVGKGGGITDEAFALKKQVLEQALEFHQIQAKPEYRYDDIIEILAKVGGLDLIGMCGLFLGAAYYQLPVVIDGFISAVAAYVAWLLCPVVKDYVFASHISAEPGYLYVADVMELEPIFHLNMRLGEGSGCPLAFSLIQSACDMMNHMATFEEAMIDATQLVDIR